jgi:cysteine synthase
VALSLVEAAERDGILKPGQPGQVLIEPTSGNTGIGLASSAVQRGYHLKVVLPTNVSIERRQLLEVWGAEIIESPGPEGSNGAVRMAQRLAASTPSGSSSTSTATPPTRRPTTSTPGPRSGATAPR